MEPSIYEILNAPPPPEVLTSDFVIRSLRRRLWKAFQQDDVETALRAYQASLEDFERWLEEEETMRRKAEEQADIEAGKSAISKVGIQFARNRFCGVERHCSNQNFNSHLPRRFKTKLRRGYFGCRRKS